MLANTSSLIFAIRRITSSFKNNENYENFIFLASTIKPPPQTVLKQFLKYNSLQISFIQYSQMNPPKNCKICSKNIVTNYYNVYIFLLTDFHFSDFSALQHRLMLSAVSPGITISNYNTNCTNLLMIWLWLCISSTSHWQKTAGFLPVLSITTTSVTSGLLNM